MSTSNSTSNNQESSHDELTSILNRATSVRLKNDNQLLDGRDRTSLKMHSYNYDNILNSYTIHVSKTLNTKRIMKNVFFWLSFTIMTLFSLAVVACPIIFLIKSKTVEVNILDYIAPAITELTSFLTVFIVIPKIITKYLFNSNEDNVMKDIVSSIQKYDKYVRNNLQNKSDDSSQ